MFGGKSNQGKCKRIVLRARAFFFDKHFQDPIRIILTVLPSFRTILNRRAKISSSSTGSRILLNCLLENVMLKQRGLTYSSALHNDSRVKKWNTFRLLVLTLCLQINFFVIIFIFPAKKVLFLWIWINERVSFISLKIKQKCLKVIFFFRILEIVLRSAKSLKRIYNLAPKQTENLPKHYADVSYYLTSFRVQKKLWICSGKQKRNYLLRYRFKKAEQRCRF